MTVMVTFKEGTVPGFHLQGRLKREQEGLCTFIISFERTFVACPLLQGTFWWFWMEKFKVHTYVRMYVLVIQHLRVVSTNIYPIATKQFPNSVAS